MKKQELVKLLAEELETTQGKADIALNTIFRTIAGVMESGDFVSIPKFGKFFTKINAARTCRNPQTGDQMEVPEKRVPKFKPALGLKELILE